MTHIMARRMRLRKLQSGQRQQKPSRAAQSYNSHHGVHLPLDLATLTRRSARVEHNLGILAGHGNASDDPVGVPHNGSTKKDGIESDGTPERPAVLADSTIVDDYGGVEAEHVDAGGLGFDGELGLSREVGGGAEVGKFGDGVARLEVGLSVEILGFDVADVLLFRSRDDDEICGPRSRLVHCLEWRRQRLTSRDTLVSSKANEISDPEVLPTFFDPNRLVVVRSAEVEMGSVDSALVSGMRRGLGVALGVVLIGVVVSLHPLVQGGRLGLDSLALLLLLLLLLGTLQISTSRRIPRHLGVLLPLLDRGSRTALLLGDGRPTNAAATPEASLALDYAVLLVLLGLLGEGALEEVVLQESRQAKRARLGFRHVRVVEGAAKGEDL